MKAFYGQEIYDNIPDLQEYQMGYFKVGQLASNGLDWGIIEGFLKNRKIVVRVPLPGGFTISLHEKQQGFDDATIAYEAWGAKEITELEDREMVKRVNEANDYYMPVVHVGVKGY